MALIHETLDQMIIQAGTKVHRRSSCNPLPKVITNRTSPVKAAVKPIS
jgi:hypothetical protein